MNMKNRKSRRIRAIRKMLYTVSAVLLLVTVTTVGTLAYLTDSKQVTNTFTIGKVNILLDEAKTDEKGVAADPTVRVNGNEYKLVPGCSYTKDPTVYLRSDSVKSYVRMKVQITNIENVKDVFGEAFLPQNFVTGWDKDTWLTTNVIDETTIAGSAIYEFWYKEPVDPAVTTLPAVEKNGESYKQLPALFTGFNVDGKAVTEANIEKLEGVKIIVTANAIQADGFADEAAAWKAFDEQASK